MTEGIRKVLYSMLTLCVLIGAVLFAPKSSASTQSIEYDHNEVKTFPEGCGTAFQDVVRFMEFFESAASMLVVNRGPQARGAVDLFAVIGLRNRLLEINANYSSESPIDRLVIAQLCQFRKIRAQQQLTGQVKGQQISAADEDLHAHLAAVAASLLKDAHMIVKSALVEKARLSNEERLLAQRKSQVLEAKRAGEQKAESLVNPGSN